jgi:hypothetical protein
MWKEIVQIAGYNQRIAFLELCLLATPLCHSLTPQVYADIMHGQWNEGLMQAVMLC